MSQSSYTYAGSEIKPDVIVEFNKQAISKNEYTVSYSDNKNVGTATVTITGGTIINTDGSALVVNDGTVTIGTEDGTIDITSPVFQGYTSNGNVSAYGLEIQAGTVNVYDGIFKGKADGINTPTSVNHPSDTTFDTDDTEVLDGKTYKHAYLVSNSPTP